MLIFGHPPTPPADGWRNFRTPNKGEPDSSRLAELGIPLTLVVEARVVTEEKATCAVVFVGQVASPDACRPGASLEPDAGVEQFISI